MTFLTYYSVLDLFSFRMLSSNKLLLGGYTYIIEFGNSQSVVPRPTSIEFVRNANSHNSPQIYYISTSEDGTKHSDFTSLSSATNVCSGFKPLALIQVELLWLKHGWSIADNPHTLSKPNILNRVLWGPSPQSS